MRTDISIQTWGTIQAAEAHLLQSGWTRVGGSVWFIHRDFPASKAEVFLESPGVWRARAETLQTFRRFVLTAEQQAVVVAALGFISKQLRDGPGTRGNDEHLKAAELRRIFAEGGQECDEEGNEVE